MTHRLRLVFEELERFREEYERNMSAGGAFVHTEHAIELREQVEVELSLAFCGQTLVLEAEVVHQMPGAVAVQFLEHASDLRARLREHLEGASE
ncbi:MAG: PilZ domain-containing protein, partial [bacterium]|nr:PilZ domain-containing protein [bacterium]